ncbi:MAG: hypothetical protein AAFX05_09795 [Planctomycetota bacterium]
MQPYVILLLIPLVVVGVFALLSRCSRWGALAARFPAAPERPRDARLCSIAVRWVWLGYNGCTWVASDDTALHLRSMLPFHRAVSIPWDHVEDVSASVLGRARIRADGFALWVPRTIVQQELQVRAAMEQEQPVD